MPEGDPFKDPNMVAFARHVLKDMVPKVDESAACIELVLPPRHEGERWHPGDVKVWVELGYMIMANKPIIAVLFGDTDIPPALEAVAEEVVRLPDGANPEGAREIAEAFQRVVARHGLGT